MGALQPAVRGQGEKRPPHRFSVQPARQRQPADVGLDTVVTDGVQMEAAHRIQHPPLGQGGPAGPPPARRSVGALLNRLDDRGHDLGPGVEGRVITGPLTRRQDGHRGDRPRPLPAQHRPR